jgi:hypothetical protein
MACTYSGRPPQLRKAQGPWILVLNLILKHFQEFLTKCKKFFHRFFRQEMFINGTCVLVWRSKSDTMQLLSMQRPLELLIGM